VQAVPRRLLEARGHPNFRDDRLAEVLVVARALSLQRRVSSSLRLVPERLESDRGRHLSANRNDDKYLILPLSPFRLAVRMSGFLVKIY
jgi:hypothetical protein